NAVAQLDDLNVAVTLAPNAFVAVLAENKRLAVLQLNDVLAARIALGEVEPRSIVEYVAVLQDFDERRAFVGRSVFERFFQVLLENVDGARDKSRLGADSERNRIERPVERTKRSGLRFLADLGRRRILAFR